MKSASEGNWNFAIGVVIFLVGFMALCMWAGPPSGDGADEYRSEIRNTPHD